MKMSALAFMLFTALLLVACSGEDEAALSSYIYKIKTRPTRPIEPIPEFKPIPKFVYPEDDLRRSPFKPVVEDRGPDPSAPNTTRAKQPLEAYPLDALKFVGLLKEGSTVWGLVSQPGGIVARVRTGDYMGQNYGLIISIEPGFMTIEETIQAAGKWEKKRIKMNLLTPPPAEKPGT